MWQRLLEQSQAIRGFAFSEAQGASGVQGSIDKFTLELKPQ